MIQGNFNLILHDRSLPEQEQEQTQWRRRKGKLTRTDSVAKVRST